MEAKSTLLQLFRGNKFTVPKYQRAYSWETPRDNHSGNTHTDVFLNDLEEHLKSKTSAPYYFGHFLFEDLGDNEYNIIDGQQRMTTIVIFLSALFSRMEKFVELTDDELDAKEEIIKKRSRIHFSTVDYDNLFFKDYVINGTQTHRNNLNTTSKKRIANAYDYFYSLMAEKDIDYLRSILKVITKSICTTHPVEDESFAIQMFIFQNNRGKKPSNLEIVKAQFMYHAHLYASDEADGVIADIKDRFEEIYKSISTIEYKVAEDEVLLYTLKVYFNSLWEANALDKIDKELNKSADTHFIISFTQELANSFNHLKKFFNEDEKSSFSIHSLISLGGFSLAVPFILKAYKFGLEAEEIGKLSKAFESIILRNRLIGTRADFTSRISGEYDRFTTVNCEIADIIDTIESYKKRTDYWGGHWRDQYFENSLNGNINRRTARFILWKYENHLKSQGQSGYVHQRFTDIEKPELEHIAPTTEPTVKPHGYPVYDEEFQKEYLNCLGNWLLLSKSHNSSASNEPFASKLKDYRYLAQQLEISDFAVNRNEWTKDSIAKRKGKIINFLMDSF